MGAIRPDLVICASPPSGMGALVGRNRHGEELIVGKVGPSGCDSLACWRALATSSLSSPPVTTDPHVHSMIFAKYHSLLLSMLPVLWITFGWEAFVFT